MDKTTTFSKQRFRRSFFAFGRTTAPSNNSEIGLWRSFFASGRTTAPTGTGRISSFGGRSSGLDERPAIALFLSFVGRSWEVDRLVLGERPATALLNSNFCYFGWANDRRLFCLWILSLLQKALFPCFSASISVLFRLDFRASYQLI